MPRVAPADATLILDHVLGNPSYPTAAVDALLAALPFPSDPTPRLRRAVLLGLLTADPVSASSLDTLQLLASLPASASLIAAAHIAVAAFLAASAPDFNAAARALRRAENVGVGGSPALASDEAIATVDQFEAAELLLRPSSGACGAAGPPRRSGSGSSSTPSGLRLGRRRVREQIVGDGAVETWRAADEATRAKFSILAGEEKTREILSKLEEPTSSANPISTPAVEKVIGALKTSFADLHSVVEDPLPPAKAVADEVLAARMEKGVSLNAEEVRGQPTTCGTADPSAPNDKDKGPSTGKPHSLMDWNPTAGPFGYGSGNWKDILNNNLDVFIGRTPVVLKDK